jgi:hypothetical protein
MLGAIAGIHACKPQMESIGVIGYSVGGAAEFINQKPAVM